MDLNQLQDNQGARHCKMRVGRGIGSGKGKTCGRGVKGQTSRTGVAIKGFEGGQMPIHRRLPKRGFNNHSRIEYDVVNLVTLQQFIDAGKLVAGEITRDMLVELGVTSVNRKIKLLGRGVLKSKIIITVDKASKSAIEVVQGLGGLVNVAA